MKVEMEKEEEKGEGEGKSLIGRLGVWVFEGGVGLRACCYVSCSAIKQVLVEEREA